MLLPVLATMLHFSPAEVAKCQEASSGTDHPSGADASTCHCDVRQCKKRSGLEQVRVAAERVVAL